VQLVGGLPGLSHRRLRVVPLAHTPSFYIERPSLTRVQRGLKRGLDVGLASLALVIASPLFAMVALTIFLDDRGPVFYRQTRVGRDGREFRVWKFRTMIREADTQVAALSSANERSGPLFKVARDPRRTRVGRVLEATSIDELPQLINVVRGEMSLVGPRPCLFNQTELIAERTSRGVFNARPGITGLSQIKKIDMSTPKLLAETDALMLKQFSLSDYFNYGKFFYFLNF
jgi:lipopolysaccharide/colanic/teichoic acid biosynthesis glycosyltransferase